MRAIMSAVSIQNFSWETTAYTGLRFPWTGASSRRKYRPPTTTGGSSRKDHRWFEVESRRATHSILSAPFASTESDRGKRLVLSGAVFRSDFLLALALRIAEHSSWIGRLGTNLPSLSPSSGRPLLQIQQSGRFESLRSRMAQTRTLRRIWIVTRFRGHYPDHETSRESGVNVPSIQVTR